MDDHGCTQAAPSSARARPTPCTCERVVLNWLKRTTKEPRGIPVVWLGKWIPGLVNLQKTMEGSTIFHGKTHCKLPFSIVMLVYQRVQPVMIENTWLMVDGVDGL